MLTSTITAMLFPRIQSAQRGGSRDGLYTGCSLPGMVLIVCVCVCIFMCVCQHAGGPAWPPRGGGGGPRQESALCQRGGLPPGGR